MAGISRFGRATPLSWEVGIYGLVPLLIARGFTRCVEESLPDLASVIIVA
jgi:hypothetical protein